MKGDTWSYFSHRYMVLEPQGSWFFFLLQKFFFLLCFRWNSMTGDSNTPVVASATPIATSTSSTRPALIKIKHLSTVHLDRSNYFTWKAQILAHLQGYELLRFVEEAVTESGPSLAQQDQLLLAWLFLAISPSVLLQVTGHKTSREVWVALEEIFNTRSRSRILQLKYQLQIFAKMISHLTSM